MAKQKVEEQEKQVVPETPAASEPAAVAEEGLTTSRPTTDANVWIQVIGSVICTMRKPLTPAGRC